MNNLGICIVSPAYSTLSLDGVMDSVVELPVSVTTYIFETFQEVRHHLEITNDDWNLILYDRERFDSNFVDAIEVMMEAGAVDAYRFCCLRKTEGVPHLIQSIRMYKNGVTLAKHAMRPEKEGLQVVRILDGWIFEDGTEKDVCSFSRSQETAEQPETGSAGCGAAL